MEALIMKKTSNLTPGRETRRMRNARGNPFSAARISANRSGPLEASVAAVIESLEGRTLLSSVGISNGSINLQAADGNDVFMISRDAANNSLVDVTFNGALSQYPSGWAG